MRGDSNILQQSFIDAEALEMIRSYGLAPTEYELVRRQDDYYMTLISRVCRLLRELLDENKAAQCDEIKVGLLEVAKGLLLYSNKNTKDLFFGVNPINNTLFVAAIYYVCQYEAIASLVLRERNISEFQTMSGRQIYYLISLPKIEVDAFPEIGFVEQFVKTGDITCITNVIERLETDTKEDRFESVREYFDSQILCAVLKKFINHNLCTILKYYDPSVNWDSYIHYSKTEKHILSFLPSQEDAIEKGLLTFTRSFCLGMSTSGGKSYITELLIYQELQKHPQTKILYLAPLRSLNRELKESYRDAAKKLHFKLRCNYGGHVSEIDDANMDEAQLIISTPEAFMSVDVYEENFSLIICDEGQLIDDPSRGIEYELLLSRLMQLDNVRFLFLSAIIPNLGDVNEWIGGDAMEVGNSPYRPCRQRLGVVRMNNKQCLVDMYDTSFTEPLFSIPLYGEYPQNIDRTSLCVALAHHVLHAGAMMVYVYSKSECMRFVNKLLQRDLPAYGYDVSHGLLRDVIEYCEYQMGADYTLVQCLRQGFAYHHADIPQDIREYIEKLLVRKEIQWVVSTSTLSEGVNFPVRTLFMAYISYYDPSIQRQNYVSTEKLKNIVGRVGRAGREYYGTIIVPNEMVKTHVIPALQSNIDKLFRGVIYDYLHSLPDISLWYENEKLVTAIDYTITKSKSGEEIDLIDVQALAKNTFAYKFGTDIERDWLVRMFETRHNELKNRFDTETYKVYQMSGLSIYEIDRLNQLISAELVDAIKLYDESNLMVILRQLFEIAKAVKLYPDAIENDKEYPQDMDVILGVVGDWMQGKRYVTIARERQLNVRQVTLVILETANSYSYKIQSILTYVTESNNIMNEVLANIPIYLQQGIYSDFMRILMSERLADRLAVHVVNYIARQKGWSEYSNSVIIDLIKKQRDRIEEEVDGISGLPILTKGKIKEWLKYLQIPKLIK